MLIHFRRGVPSELLPHFHWNTSVRHDARERMPEGVKRQRVHAAALLALPFFYDFPMYVRLLLNVHFPIS
jgi:hypothetical protein